jgi:hypothetical protein
MKTSANAIVSESTATMLHNGTTFGMPLASTVANIFAESLALRASITSLGILTKFHTFC